MLTIQQKKILFLENQFCSYWSYSKKKYFFFLNILNVTVVVVVDYTKENVQKRLSLIKYNILMRNRLLYETFI